MPEIKTYEQQYLPQGTFNAQASPDQMGAGIGAAISDLGETFRKIESDKGETWAYKNAGDLFDKLKQNYNEELAKLDPRDPEYLVKVNNVTANYKPRIEQETASLMEQAPSGYARKALDRYMLQNSRSLMGEAIQRQASISAEYTRGQLEDTIVQDAQSIAGDPSNANFNRVLQNRREMIANIQNPDITPEMKIKWLQDTTRKLAQTQVMTEAKTNPNFLKMISPNGGKIEAPRGDGTSFGDAVAFVLEKEGGYTASDGESGAPANFGINQRANPDIDVKNLTQDRAVQIYKERYWNAIGGDSLPKPTAMVAFNIAVNMGVGAAKDLLEKSGGDPTRFTALAKQRYMDIVANNPKQEKYLAGWLARADATLAAAGAPRNILPQVKMLSDEEIMSAKPGIEGAKYLTPEELWTATRAAEGAASQKLSIEQAEIASALKDVEAVLLDGKEFPSIDDGRFSEANLKRLFGDFKGGEAYKQVENLKRVAPLIATMSRMPNDQVNAALEKERPAPGPGYDEKNRVFKTLVEGVRKVREARASDYMGWALSTEGTNVKPLDYTDLNTLRESIVARIPAAIQARQAHGVNAGLLSKTEVSDLSNTINKSDAGTTIEIIKQMRAATLNHDGLYVQMMGQLSENVPNFAVAGSLSIKKGTVDTDKGTVSADAVVRKIVNGSFILKGNGVDEKDKTPRPVQIEPSYMLEVFNEATAGLFNGPDERMSAELRSQYQGAVTSYVAAEMIENGVVKFDNNFSEASKYVTRAVKAITGGSVSVGYSSIFESAGKVFLPWGMSEKRFNREFPVAFADAIKANPPPPELKMPTDPNYLQFINAGRDGEYKIVDPYSKKVVFGKNGPLVIKMSQDRTGGKF